MVMSNNSNNTVSAELPEDANTCQILPPVPRTNSMQPVATHESKQDQHRTISTTTATTFDDSRSSTKSQQIQTKDIAYTGRQYKEESTLRAQNQPPQQSSSHATIPPPTPSDSLRRSPLFASDESCTNQQIGQFGTVHSDESILPKRPQSSYGHGQARKGLEDVKQGGTDSRRISIGDGLPIQGLPMVTPTPKNGTSGTNKRPHDASLSDIDPTHTKKVSTNPYSVSSGISRPQK